MRKAQFARVDIDLDQFTQARTTVARLVHLRRSLFARHPQTSLVHPLPHTFAAIAISSTVAASKPCVFGRIMWVQLRANRQARIFWEYRSALWSPEFCAGAFRCVTRSLPLPFASMHCRRGLPCEVRRRVPTESLP